MKYAANMFVEHMTASEEWGFHNYGICGAFSIEITYKNYRNARGVDLEVENPVWMTKFSLVTLLSPFLF